MEKTRSIQLLELDQRVKNADVLVIDVRSEEEFNENHIPFAIHIPLDRILEKKENFDLGKTIITVCGKGGGRSERAAEFIQEQYHVKAWFLEGGTFGWIKKNEATS
jgi:rhodanese-related sulfurtransferase